MPWPDTWSLVIDAKGAHMLDRKCVTEAKALEVVRYGGCSGESTINRKRPLEADTAAASLKWRKTLRVDRDEGHRDTGEILPWWYMRQLRGNGCDDDHRSDLHIPEVVKAGEWRRLALDDIKRRRAATGDILRGARARKGQRVVWSDSDGDELERGHNAGALGEGGVDERSQGGRPERCASMRGSTGDGSVAVAAEAVERVTGLDGELSQARA